MDTETNVKWRVGFGMYVFEFDTPSGAAAMINLIANRFVPNKYCSSLPYINLEAITPEHEETEEEEE